MSPNGENGWTLNTLYTHLSSEIAGVERALDRHEAVSREELTRLRVEITDYHLATNKRLDALEAVIADAEKHSQFRRFTAAQLIAVCCVLAGLITTIALEVWH